MGCKISNSVVIEPTENIHQSPKNPYPTNQIKNKIAGGYISSHASIENNAGDTLNLMKEKQKNFEGKETGKNFQIFNENLSRRNTIGCTEEELKCTDTLSNDSLETFEKAILKKRPPITRERTAFSEI